MEKIIIEIETCRGCPFFDEGMGYSTDGWDTVHDWFCKKADYKITASAVGWDNKPAIPAWCPSLFKNYENKKD